MDQSLENNIAKEINSRSTNSCYSKLKKGKQQFFFILSGTRIAKLTISSIFFFYCSLYQEYVLYLLYIDLNFDSRIQFVAQVMIQ